MSRNGPAYDGLTPRARRRMAVYAVLRSLLVSCALVVVYAVLPLDQPVDAATVVELALGLSAVGLLLAWDLREVARSSRPRLRAIETLATIVPLFLLLFSAAYFVMDQSGTGSFSQPMTRVDAVYLTVTVFATVGFGDITPVTEVARVVVTVQMLADLVIVGLVAKVLLGAVQQGLRRQAGDGAEEQATRDADRQPG